MACGTCGGRRSKNEKVVWQVTYRDGTQPPPFLTELEAKAAVSVKGGSYTRVLQRK